MIPEEQAPKYMKTLETYLGFEIYKIVKTIIQTGSSHLESQVIAISSQLRPNICYGFFAHMFRTSCGITRISGSWLHIYLIHSVHVTSLGVLTVW